MCENNDEYIRRIVAEELEKLIRKDKKEVEEIQKSEEKVDEIDPDNNIPTLMLGRNIIKFYPKENHFEVISKDDQKIGVNCGETGVPFKKGNIYGCSIKKKD